MTGDPRIDAYEWLGNREAMLRFGPDTGPVVVVALPLLEEANRTRAFVVAILRSLAARGIGSVLPDMPGQGESLALIETVSLADMRTAFAAAAAAVGRDGRAIYAIAVRSGALLPNHLPRRGRNHSPGPLLPGNMKAAGAIDGDGGRCNGSWHLAPQDGPSLMREWSRMKAADSGADRSGDAGLHTLIAGNLLSAALLADVATALPVGPARTVRLSTDPAPADWKVDGAPLWRRSEPGTDQALSQMLADDIADWISACER